MSIDFYKLMRVKIPNLKKTIWTFGIVHSFIIDYYSYLV